MSKKRTNIDENVFDWLGARLQGMTTRDPVYLPDPDDEAPASDSDLPGETADEDEEENKKIEGIFAQLSLNLGKAEGARAYLSKIIEKEVEGMFNKTKVTNAFVNSRPEYKNLVKKIEKAVLDNLEKMTQVSFSPDNYKNLKEYVVKEITNRLDERCVSLVPRKKRVIIRIKK